MTKRKRDDKGAAMVEFAIILPVLIMLLMGIIEFGRAYNTQVSIQAAAREGARELALRHPAQVDAAVRNGAPSVSIDTIEQTPCPALGSTQANDAIPDNATVKISESFTFGIPFVPLGTTTLKATGVMRCGL